MNLGVFLPNWIGDVAMATPTLRALRRQWPHARLTGIMRPYVAEVLAGTPWLDEMLFYDPRSGDSDRQGWRFVRQLRAARLDTAVLLTNSWRTGMLAWLSGAPRRVGYARNGRGWLLTDRLYVPRGMRKTPAPVLDYYLELAYELGCTTESPRLELATTPIDEAAADVAWQRLRLPAGRQVIAINSGGAFGSAKLWPTEYFVELARRIVRQTDRAVLVLCGPSERDIARQIVQAASDERVVSLADEPVSIGLTKACVRRSRLLVTTDSGPRHFAAAFDVPVITLFGPTHIAWSENHYRRAVHLQHRVDCGPCQQRACPLGHHRCMRDLTVDDVFRTVAATLNQERHADAA